MATYTEKWLADNGFDGLYCAGVCACEMSDLALCEEGPTIDCQPGYKHIDPRPENKGAWAMFESKDIPDTDVWDGITY